jgi:hypothetical protein
MTMLLHHDIDYPAKNRRDDAEDLRGTPGLLFGGSTYPGRGRSRIPVSGARRKFVGPSRDSNMQQRSEWRSCV